MVDIKMQNIPEKTTNIVSWDKTLIIDSEDLNKTKVASASKFIWPQGPKWDTWPQWPTWDTWPQWPKWDQWLIWQWAYDNDTQYYTDDAVSDSWNSYIAIQDTIGNAPTDTTYWNLIAQKGADWSGSWDMVAATYDPNNIAADCFSQDNMENWDTNVNYTKTEQDKLAWIEDWANVNVQADYNETDDTQYDYIKNKPDLSVYEITADKVTAWESTPDDTHYPSEKLTKDSLDWKEPTITKNTAFNKDFWTASWTVMEWDTNVGIVWTKTVDETDIADKTIIQYDSANDKYVCVAPPSWWGGGSEVIFCANWNSTSLTAWTVTTLNYNTNLYDKYSWYNTTTYEYTISSDWYYYIECSANSQSGDAALQMRIIKNGSYIWYLNWWTDDKWTRISMASSLVSWDVIRIDWRNDSWSDYDTFWWAWDVFIITKL